MPKRKKQNLILFISLVLSVIIFLLTCVLYCNERLQLKEVAIAKYTLNNRTLITEDEIEIVKLPCAYLSDNVVEKEDVVGKYVSINTTIPRGSLFYNDSIEDYDSIKDKLNTDLLEGEVAFDISASHIKANQAYLNKGMYVDIYLTISKDKVLSDLLINNVKIIGLYDANKKEIKDYDNDSLLNSICIAVPKDALPYLNKAEVVGDLSIVVGNDTYNKVTSVLNYNSEIFNYLN